MIIVLSIFKSFIFLPFKRLVLNITDDVYFIDTTDIQLLITTCLLFKTACYSMTWQSLSISLVCLGFWFCHLNFPRSSVFLLIYSPPLYIDGLMAYISSCFIHRYNANENLIKRFFIDFSINNYYMYYSVMKCNGKMERSEN